MPVDPRPHIEAALQKRHRSVELTQLQAKVLRRLSDADGRGSMIQFDDDLTVTARELVALRLAEDEGPTYLGSGRYYGINDAGRVRIRQKAEKP